MVDVEKRDLWALFVAPEHEFKGLGKALHEIMVNCYFKRTNCLRLSTAPHTRAAAFYGAAGYKEIGPTSNGKELIFELHKPR
jgi:GNAT superfamily N-acetyltransferase